MIADVATGTNLFDMGLAIGASGELWCAAHPDRVRAFVRPVRGHLIDVAFNLVERRRQVRTVVYGNGGQVHGDDVFGRFVDAQMQPSPRAPESAARLFDPSTDRPPLSMSRAPIQERSRTKEGEPD